MNEKIEGVPDGWELVRIGTPENGEFFIDANGSPMQCIKKFSKNLVIIRKIEKPKKYRPFANAEEFEPFRHLWWRFKDNPTNRQVPPCSFCDIWHNGLNWESSFASKVFDDGSPFGIEVTE